MSWPSLFWLFPLWFPQCTSQASIWSQRSEGCSLEKSITETRPMYAGTWGWSQLHTVPQACRGHQRTRPHIKLLGKSWCFFPEGHRTFQKSTKAVSKLTGKLSGKKMTEERRNPCKVSGEMGKERDMIREGEGCPDRKRRESRREGESKRER